MRLSDSESNGAYAVEEAARCGQFRFSMCGIRAGAEVVFVDDMSKRAVVVDDRHVSFANETTSLSTLLQNNSKWRQLVPNWNKLKTKAIATFHVNGYSSGTVVGYFDYIERIIKRHQTFTMEQFARSVNAFLEFNEYEILEGMGTVSRAQADEKAYSEYDEFNKHQMIESDFDRQIKLLLDASDDEKRPQ